MNAMKTDYTGWTINYGFLTGNLGDDADYRGWAAAVETALQEKFPGAKINVKYQHAEGSLPSPLKLHVYGPEDADGVPEYADGSVGIGEAASILHSVEYVIEKLDMVYV